MYGPDGRREAAREIRETRADGEPPGKGGDEMSRPSGPPIRVRRALAAFFYRNGCVRRHDPVRYGAEGYMKYKKGDEVRLMANTDAECVQVLQLLRIAGFNPGHPFRKGRHLAQYCVPLYGRDQVARFLGMIEETRAYQ